MSEEKKVDYKVMTAATQAPRITDEMINDAKKMYGVDLRVGRATIEITEEDIQNYCNMIDCINPLYLDERYAKKTRWGGIIAPPPMAGQVGAAIIDTGLPGIHGYHCGNSWEWFQVARPGDILISRIELVDMIEHHGAHASRMIETVTKREIRNQQGDLVCNDWYHVMRVPRASGGEGGLSYEPRIQKWTEEALVALRAEIDAQKVRGNAPRFWEDAKEGEAMDPIVLGPLRNVDISFAGGLISSSDRGGSFAYHIIHRRRHPADTYINPVTGAQEEPHRGHTEEWMARQAGMPGRYDGGPTRTSLMARYVCDWMGDDAFLKKCWVTLRRPRLVADVVWGRGKVVRKWIEGDDRLVECEIYLQDQTGEKTTSGRAVIMLPSRVSGLPRLP